MANLKPKKRGRVLNVSDEITPKDIAIPEVPHELDEQAVGALRKYIKRYSLPVNTPMTLEGFLLRGPAGLNSESGNNAERSVYGDAAQAVNDHLRGGLIKEGDAIAEFIYAITNRNSELKLQFGGPETSESFLSTETMSATIFPE